MSSGTFGYPLGFAALLAVIGLAVSGGPMGKARRAEGKSADSEYWGRGGNEIRQELIARCDDYVRRYPDAEDIESFACMVVAQFVETGDWLSAGERCAEIVKRFPNSAERGDYLFFQGLGMFDAGDVPGAIKIFRCVLKDAPYCGLNKSARHYLARSYFLRDHEGQADVPDWLRHAPGPFPSEGGARNPFSFEKESDVGCTFGVPPSEIYRNPYLFSENGDGSEEGLRVIRFIEEFLARHPDDAALGSTLCLLGRAREAAGDAEGALECYRKSAWSECPDDVAALGLDSAAALLLDRDGRAGAVGLYREFLKHRPEGVLAVEVAGKLATVVAKEGNAEEAERIQSAALKPRIGDPSAVQAEFLLDEIVKSMVPRGEVREMDADALDKQLVERLERIASEDANATAKARIYYARARLAQLLKRKDRSELHLKGIALSHLKDPSALSPALLSVSGETLLKLGDMDGAETMFRFLKDHHAAGFGDAASVGLGKVALARGKPEEAHRIFDEVLALPVKNPDAARDATIGKLQALLDLNKADEVLRLGTDAVGNKAFRGEQAARIYLLLGRAYERKADGAGADASDFLEKALAAYQRVEVAYQGFPELKDEASRRADEVRRKL